MTGIAKPAAKPAAKIVGVADAIDQLERRRRRTGKNKSTGRRNDLDLDGIR